MEVFEFWLERVVTASILSFAILACGLRVYCTGLGSGLRFFREGQGLAGVSTSGVFRLRGSAMSNVVLPESTVS